MGKGERDRVFRVRVRIGVIHATYIFSVGFRIRVRIRIRVRVRVRVRVKVMVGVRVTANDK